MLKSKHTFGITILAALLLFTAPATAGVILFAGSTTALPGAVGNTFDVLITNTGPSAINVAVFSFEILASSTDVTFTDATTATVAGPYIFTGHSLFGPDIVNSSPGQTLDALDLFDTLLGSTTVASGATFGLGHIFFNVSNTANTPETVTVSFNALNSSLSDANGNAMPINTFQSGTITVSSTVPEPSAAIPLLAGLAWIYSRRRSLRGSTSAVR